MTYDLGAELRYNARAAWRLTRSHDAVDDLAQEAVIAGWQQYKRSGNPRLAAKAARYRMQGLLYQPMPHRQMGGSSIRHKRPHLTLDQAAGLPCTEDALEHAEELADLRRALAELPPRLREYAQRRYFGAPGELGKINHKLETELLARLRERMQVQ